MESSSRWPLLAIALVSVAALAPAIFLGRIPAQTEWIHTYGPWITSDDYPLHNPLGGDSFYVYLPDRLVAVDQWKQGSLPLWNPYPSGGLPILGGQTANPLDPLILLMLVLPLGPALGVTYALLCFAAGAGVVLYLRSQGLRSTPALAVGGITFALCPYFVYWLELRVFLAGMALLPLSLWALERVLRNRTRVRSGSVLALCVGYSALAGTLQLLVLFLGVLAVRTLWVLADRNRVPQPGRALTTTGAGLLAGLALGFLPIVAGFELLGQGSRGFAGVAYYADANFLHWRAMALWFNPQVFGGPGDGIFVAGPLFHRTLAGSSGWGSLGLLPLWLAILALARRAGPRSERLFWGGLWGACLGFLMLMATPLYGVLSRLFPILDEVDLLRGLVVVNLAGAVLAARGAEELLTLWERPDRRWWIAALALYLLAGAGIVVLARSGLETPHPLLRDFLPLLAATGLVLLLGFLPAARGGSAGWKVWILTLATAVEFVRFSFLFNTFSPADSAYPENIRTAELQRRLGPPAHYRLFVHEHWRFLPPNTGAVYGIPDIRGYSNIPISRYRLLLECAEGRSFRNQVFLENASSPVYRLLGGAYLITGSPLDPDLYRQVPNWRSLYQRRNPLPRAFLGHRVVAVAGETGMRAALSDSTFDPAAVVYLEAGETAPEVAPAVRTEGLAIARLDPARVLVKVEASAPGVLVLTDVYYPGWRATVDRRPVRILPVNWGLRGVPVSAGYHEVEFTYRPAWLRPGLGISAAALAAILLGLALPLSRRRNRGSGAPGPGRIGGRG